MMGSQRMYVSYAIEDAELVGRLLAALEMVGITVLKENADAIAGADAFVACFASGSGAAARYNCVELQRAIDHARPIMLAKLTPCEVPSLPGILASAPILDLQGHWTESIAQLIAPPATAGSAMFTFKSAQTAVSGDAEFVNVERAGGTAATTDAHSDITIDHFVTDGNLRFTGVRN